MAGYYGQVQSRVPARLLSTEANDNVKKNGVTDQPLFVVNDMQRFSYALDEEKKAENKHTPRLFQPQRRKNSCLPAQ
ncbi:MAG: hypothetical protein IJB69_08860 [Clostridia bacterium]|nr:hypothetical protein [Clostridia bacterium]